MSDSAHPADALARQAEGQASARVASPTAFELLDSLAADYKAGKLPDDVKAQVEALRDEWQESVKDRLTDLKNDVLPDLDAMVTDIKAQVQAYDADGGRYNSEEIDSRMVPIVVDVVDGLVGKVAEPIIDAVEDVVHDTFGLADQLLQIRADHDPEGIYAAKLETAQAELSQADDRFDDDMVQVHDDVAAVREQFQHVRDEAEEFHQNQAPVQFIMSTTVDPHLPEQMNEETGEGAA